MKRIYTDKGSMPVWLAYLALLIAYLPVQAYAYLSVLFEEIGTAHWLAKNEVRHQHRNFKRLWWSAR